MVGRILASPHQRHQDMSLLKHLADAVPTVRALILLGILSFRSLRSIPATLKEDGRWTRSRLRYVARDLSLHLYRQMESLVEPVLGLLIRHLARAAPADAREISTLLVARQFRIFPRLVLAEYC